MPNQDVELTIERVKEILENGDFDEFTDRIEGDYFEAKQQKPYAIDSKDNDERFSARIKLVNDIAALANAKGGYIVCGLSTEIEEALQTDKVNEIKLFDEGSFYTQDVIQEVVKAHVEPELKVAVIWHPSSSDSNLGIGSIYVPPQIESKKYFIVTAVEIEGVKQKHFVSIPIRQGSKPFWLSAKQIYRHAASRKPYELKQVHDSLSGQIAELRDIVLTEEGVTTPADDLQRKIEEVLDVH